MNDKKHKTDEDTAQKFPLQSLSRDIGRVRGQDIQLRSEKVRNIIGQVPPILLRYGITIIIVTLIILVGLSALIPYYPTFKVSVLISQNSDRSFEYTSEIPQELIKYSGYFEQISLTDNINSEKFPKYYDIKDIDKKLFINKNNSYYFVYLFPLNKQPDNTILINPIAIPAKLELEKTTLYNWIKVKMLIK